MQDPTIPWWRIIGSSGQISHRGDDGQGAQRQLERLTAEGVVLTAGGRVDWTTWGWDGIVQEGLASQGSGEAGNEDGDEDENE